MATVNDVTTTPKANANWIDAMLNIGPSWNFLTGNGVTFQKTIYYTFDISTGTQSGSSSIVAFNSAQTIAARSIINYVSQITGISFQETAAGTSADWHFAQKNLSSTYAGFCNWNSLYNYQSANTLTSYSADAYVYLDNRSETDWYSTNQNPSSGGVGYEVLLHEVGHALGLKHPFETESDNSATLSSALDNTSNTVMSYTWTGSPKTTFQRYDLTALYWLYGGDGLGGSWGVGTSGKCWSGTGGDDAITLSWTSNCGYNYAVSGLGGNDLVALAVAKSNTSFLYDGTWLILSGSSGSNKVYIAPDVEQIRFSDGTWSFSSLASGTTPADTTPSTAWLTHNYVNAAEQVYVAYFGRPADLAGIRTTEDQIAAAGGDKAAITSMFANSPESQAFFAGKTVEQKVDTAYQQLFNRAAETAGKDYWVHQLDLGLMNQVTMCIRILDGAQGSDLATINNKVAAAKDFTEHVSSTAYAGNTAAANGRMLISSIGVDVGDVEKAHTAVQTAAFSSHLATDVSADLALVGLHAGQYYVG